MSYFGILKHDNIVQVDDKIRLRATDSFVAKGSTNITGLELEPDLGGGFINIFSPNKKDWFLDWVYLTEGEKEITLNMIEGLNTYSFTSSITVLTEAQDYLFSNDNDLIGFESDVLKYLPEEKSSYKFMHRKAQTKILDWLDRNRFYKQDLSKITKTDLIDKSEVREWSTYLTLELIYRNISNATDDVFSDKAKYYSSRANDAANRSVIAFDFNNDGVLDNSDKRDLRTRPMVRA